MKAGYPLEALQTIRSAAVESAAVALDEALAHEESVRTELARAIEERRAFEADTEQARGSLANARGAGVRGSGFVDGARYLERRCREADELARSVSVLRRKAGEARRATEAARAALARSHADAELVERHRGRWEDRRDERDERRREDEAEDVALARLRKE
jgi:hypothetical protein